MHLHARNAYVNDIHCTYALESYSENGDPNMLEREYIFDLNRLDDYRSVSLVNKPLVDTTFGEMGDLGWKLFLRMTYVNPMYNRASNGIKSHLIFYDVSNKNRRIVVKKFDKTTHGAWAAIDGPKDALDYIAKHGTLIPSYNTEIYSKFRITEVPEPVTVTVTKEFELSDVVSKFTEAEILEYINTKRAAEIILDPTRYVPSSDTIYELVA